jgi:hypothetical protein
MIGTLLAIAVFAATTAQAQAPYQPAPASPPNDAGYVLPDGTIQIVGWDDLAGIFARLDALYEKTHPGTKLTYVTGNLIAPQHSLIFGETAFAPTGMEFSTGLNSAYRPQVKAPTFSVRIAHGAVQGDAKLGPLVGTALSLPIFDGGRNKSNLARANASYESQVGNYRQQVLVGFQEVEDSLSALRTLDRQIAYQDQAVASS